MCPSTDLQEILDEVGKAGWHPLRPNPECCEATEAPLLPRHLSPVDRVGIHWELVGMEMIARFGQPRGYTGSRGRFLLYLASLHVLVQLGTEGDLTADRVARHYDDLWRWHTEILGPPGKRLWEATRHDDVSLDASYEPAWTLTRLEAERGTFDPARDMEAMSRGRAMHAIQSLRPDLAAIREQATSEDELRGYFELISPDRALFYFDRKGEAHLDALRVMQGLDAFGKPPPLLSNALPPGGEDQSPDREEGSSVLEGVIAIERLHRLREALDSRLSDAPSHSARAHVIRHFEELIARDLSCPELAGRVGLTARALQKALASEAHALRAEMEST